MSSLAGDGDCVSDDTVRGRFPFLCIFPRCLSLFFLLSEFSEFNKIRVNGLKPVEQQVYSQQLSNAFYIPA
jgi:hypothetical protein